MIFWLSIVFDIALFSRKKRKKYLIDIPVFHCVWCCSVFAKRLANKKVTFFLDPFPFQQMLKSFLPSNTEMPVLIFPCKWLFRLFIVFDIALFSPSLWQTKKKKWILFLFNKCLKSFQLFLRPRSEVVILDGNWEHVAHVWRKTGLFWK